MLLAALLLLGGCRSAPPPVPDPPPSETSVAPGINAEYLQPAIAVQQWVERFEQEGREVYDRRQDIVRLTAPRRGADVADIGAGTGLFTPLLAEAVGPRGRVYAVDIAADFLRRIAQRAAEAGQRNVTTVLGTDRNVALQRHSIDLAFLCDVYHHFEYPRHALASIREALRPNGELLLIDFQRVPGVSSDWVLGHVRAGQETVTAELEAAGFVKMVEYELLRESYVIRFRKVGN